MFSIREKVSVYFPVRSSDDDPTSESKDHLLPEDDFPRRKPRHWLSRVVLVSITLLYTLTVVSITITIVRRERLQGTRFTSPLSLSDYITYEPRVFSKDPRNDEIRYFDTVPSPEIDHNWHNLFEIQNIAIPPQTMKDLGRLDQGVKLPDGNYMASPMVFHSLHCLKAIYQALHPDYYTQLQNLTGRTRWIQDYHTEHCLNMLKQSLECNADMTLLTMKWGVRTPLPTGNFSSAHECVNWDRLMEWVKPRSFDAFANGVLVHPDLGPAFVDGKSVLEGPDIH